MAKRKLNELDTRGRDAIAVFLHTRPEAQQEAGEAFERTAKQMRGKTRRKLKKPAPKPVKAKKADIGLTSIQSQPNTAGIPVSRKKYEAVIKKRKSPMATWKEYNRLKRKAG